jgi:uncharacterized protein
MPPVTPEPVTIAILAKAPNPGLAKTRLVMMLGVDGAATLQARFIDHVVAAAVAAGVGPITLWGTPDEKHPAFRAHAEQHGITLKPQPKGDLGARMLAAIMEAHAPTIVVGTDCPALTAQHLKDSAAVLRDETDAVLIPSDDGGYVLIGMRRPQPVLFADMPWSTETVTFETRQRLTRLGLTWREPAQLWDVDHPSDVRRMRREGFSEMLDGLGRDPPPPWRGV